MAAAVKAVLVLVATFQLHQYLRTCCLQSSKSWSCPPPAITHSLFVSLSPLLLSQGNEGAGVREAMATELLSDRLSTEEWTAQKKKAKESWGKGRSGTCRMSRSSIHTTFRLRRGRLLLRLCWAEQRRGGRVYNNYDEEMHPSSFFSLLSSLAIVHMHLKS